MSSPAAITPVGTTFRYEFLSPEVCRSGSSVPGTAEYLYIINKIGTGHCFKSIFFSIPIDTIHVLMLFILREGGGEGVRA
jgi:hypothetical protein